MAAWCDGSRRVSVWLAFVIAVLGWVATPAAQTRGQPGRALTSDDLFNLEEIVDTVLSPDGKTAAYVVKRPKSTSTRQKYDFLWGFDRGDLWLTPVGGGVPQQITNGQPTETGYWGPVWSPDGKRIALLTVDGTNVRVAVWDQRTGRTTILDDRGADVLGYRNPVVWLGPDRLLVPVLPRGERPPSMTAEIRAAEIPMREWPKAWRGKEVTVSVIDSGVPRPWASEKHGELMLADLATGAHRPLPWARVRNIRMAHGSGRVAFAAQQGVRTPAPTELLTFDRPRERFRPVIVDPHGGEIPLKWQQELPDITPESLRWSPDGQHLMFLEILPAAGVRRLFTASAQDGTVVEVTPVAVATAAAEWTTNGDVLVRGYVRPGAPERPDWWIVPGPSSGATQSARNLTAKLPAPPATLIPTTAGDLVGLSGGALWKISARSGAHQRLTLENVTVAEIVWPLAVHDRPVSSIVVSDKLAETATLTSIDVSTGAARPVRAPKPGVTLASHSPESGATMYSLADATGSTLWLADALDSAPRVVVERNTFLRGVAEGETRLIEYRSLHGEDLKAWLILPRGYREGQRYPLITWPYLGTVARDSARSSINRYSSLNLQMLSSGGYAVLIPSMPIKPRGVPRDPLMELQNGVIPAVDKVIELGIADPKRLGIMGQSFGGYSTYGLVTQTRRFRVAVALAGLAELISLYGELDPRLRYDDQPFDNLFQPTLFETGQISLGVAPWQDSARYLRNSPLFYVERVETPIMIIQGDLDYVTMAQGEQFFTALVRQNKRARFLRYWGEGHVLETQANTRDMWERIFGWFDEFIGPDSKPPGSAAR